MGVFLGKQIMARDYARYARVHWQNYELTKAIAKAIGESQLKLGAYNDNPNGTRDCGVDQINISHAYLGTSKEFELRTESNDPDVYWPVVRNSIEASWSLYNEPYTRDGKKDIRRWQPWYAYTLGWCTFPHAWVYHHEGGVPEGEATGPWVPTSRAIFKAIAGQMNNLIVNEKIWTPEKALKYAKQYAAHFGISDGSVPYIKSGIVDWHYAPKPTAPPVNGGPYPVKNNGV